MTPGPNKILKTTLSGALVRVATLNSGNTFGAKFWTDGKCEAPMLPDYPWLRRHPGNGELFWTDECEEVGMESPWEVSHEFPNTPYADDPTAEDYLRALDAGLAATAEKERYVRMRLWWAANDPVRRGDAGAVKDRDNLLKLLALLDEGDANQRLTAAEICRELGDFDKAAGLLAFEFPKAYSPAVRLIQQLNEAKDTQVHELVR